MTKQIVKFAARLFVYHLAAMMVTLVCMLPVSALASKVNSNLLQFAINAVFLMVLYGLLWKASAEEGQKNFMRQRIEDAKGQDAAEEPVYVAWKGYAAGALAQAVPFLLMLLYLPLRAHNDTVGGAIGVLLRGYYIMYSQLIVTLEAGIPWVFLIPMAMGTLVSGLGYRGGMRQYQKVVSIIRHHDQKRMAKKAAPKGE